MVSLAASYPENRIPVIELCKTLNPKSILDVGVGGGYYGALLREAFPNIRIDGVDIIPDFRNPMWDSYDDVKLCNLLLPENYPSGYDLYLMIDIVEHWPKAEGKEFISHLDGSIIVCTPINYPQGPQEVPWQEHISEWEEADFPDFENYRHMTPLGDKCLLMMRRK